MHRNEENSFDEDKAKETIAHDDRQVSLLPAIRSPEKRDKFFVHEILKENDNENP